MVVAVVVDGLLLQQVVQEEAELLQPELGPGGGALGGALLGSGLHQVHQGFPALETQLKPAPRKLLFSELIILFGLLITGIFSVKTFELVSFGTERNVTSRN